MPTPPLTTGTAIEIRIHWQAAGAVTLDTDGKVLLPRLPTGPGLYEFRFSGDPVSVYVGESDNLRRRMSHYRNPGPTQRTNLRLNDRIRDHLVTCEVTMAIATNVNASWTGDAPQPLDLATKTARVLGESVWLLHRQRHGFSIENAAKP